MTLVSISEFLGDPVRSGYLAAVRGVERSMEPRAAGDDGSPADTSIELLRRAQGGDEAALGRLLDRYVPRLRRWTSGRLPHWARELLDTDDIVQDALIGTVRHLERFSPEHDGALLAYMRRAMRNRLLDELRRVKRHPTRESMPEQAADRAASPVDEAIGNEAMRRYEAALEGLGDSDRELVICRVEMEMPYAEIAEATGRPSADAARMGVSRALVRLAEAMGDA